MKKTDEYLNQYKNFLENKREQVKKEEQRNKHISTYLGELIKEINTVEKNNSNILGLPLPSLDILKCPFCMHSLKMEDGIIERNMVIKANFKCDCGYNARIRNGIFIDKDSVKKKMINGSPLPTKEEYQKAASPRYINFLYASMSILINNLEKYAGKPKYLMELDNCVGYFLMQYIKKLSKDTTYILIDYDLDRITHQKNNLQNHHNHTNFIFLCCDISKVPIARSSIDVMVDNCMTTNFGVANNRYLLDDVLPMLKKDGILTGTYRYFSPKTRGISNIEAGKMRYYNREFIMEKLKQSPVTLLDIVDNGPIIENNKYSLDIQGKELFHATYIVKKDIISDIKSLKRKSYTRQSKIS